MNAWGKLRLQTRLNMFWLAALRGLAESDGVTTSELARQVLVDYMKDQSEGLANTSERLRHLGVLADAFELRVKQTYIAGGDT